ncbi:MAG: hypothetical protein Q9219_004493 [cf. Caloplaca sp. 3 TL-2023]
MTSSKDLAPLKSPFFPNIFFQNQFRSKPPHSPKGSDLSDRIAVITGGNTGLGLESGRQLLSLRLSRLIIAVRSVEKGDKAAAQLRSEFPNAIIDVYGLDMGTYESIQAFVERVKAHHSRLDIAILNAGVIKQNFSLVPSTGHEETIQVNYLSTALLCILLLPLLTKRFPSTKPGRLTIINSGLAYTTKLPETKAILPSFDDPKNFDSNSYYNISKLLGHMFLYKLVEHVSGDDVVVNLADPGFIKGTGLARELPRLAAIAFSIFAALTARTVRVGASAYVDAVAGKGKESHGCFLMSWQIKPFAPMLYTVEGKRSIDRLWEETLDELEFAGVRGILKLTGEQ